MLRLAGLFVFLSLAAGSDGPAPDPAPAIRVREQEFQLYPPEKLRQRGLPVQLLPRADNAAWVYLDAINASQTLPSDLADACNALRRGDDLDPPQLERLAEFIDRQAPALDAAARAARMPHCEMFYCYDGHNEDVVAVILPMLAEVRNLTRLFEARALLSARRGDPAAAVDDCLLMQRVANHTAQGGPLINTLVGLACGESAMQSLARVLADPGLPPEVLDRAAAELDALQTELPSWQRAVDFEKSFATAILEDALHAGSTMAYLANPLSSSGAPADAAGGWHRLRTRLRRLFLPDRLIKRNAGRFYDRLIEASRKEPAASIQPVEQSALRDLPDWDVLTRIIAPSLTRSFDNARRSRANFERARMTVAVERYRRDRGAPPPSLAALVPDYLPAIAPDPFTGRPPPYSLDPSAKGYAGLELVALVPPSAESPSPIETLDAAPPLTESDWRRLVREFAAAHQFTPEQRAAARAILREIERRAATLEARQRDRAEEASPAAMKELEAELRRRLDELPTAAQRALARPPRPPEEKPRDNGP